MISQKITKDAINDLINIYEMIEKGVSNDLLKKEGNNVYSKYFGLVSLLPEEINMYVGKLVDIIYETGIKPLNKEEAKDILNKLKEYKRKYPE